MNHIRLNEIGVSWRVEGTLAKGQDHHQEEEIRADVAKDMHMTQQERVSCPLAEGQDSQQVWGQRATPSRRSRRTVAAGT